MLEPETRMATRITVITTIAATDTVVLKIVVKTYYLHSKQAVVIIWMLNMTTTLPMVISLAAPTFLLIQCSGLSQVLLVVDLHLS